MSKQQYNIKSLAYLPLRSSCVLGKEVCHTLVDLEADRVPTLRYYWRIYPNLEWCSLHLRGALTAIAATRTPKLRPLAELYECIVQADSGWSKVTKELNPKSYCSGIVGHHSDSASPTWMYIPVLGSSCCGFRRLLCRGLLLLPLLFLYAPSALFVEPFILHPELSFPIRTFAATTSSPASTYRVSSYNSPLPNGVIDLRQLNIQLPRLGLSVIECRLVE